MKRIAILLAALLLVSMFSGAALAVEEGKTYVIGTNAEFPPFEFIDDDGNFAGFDMELIAEILDRIGVPYEYETMAFSALLPALASDKIDIVIAAMTIRDDRRENALFSDPYFHATQKIIVLAGNEEIKGEADLNGKAVGVQLGTTGDIYVTMAVEWEDLEDVDIQRFDKAIDAVIDLTTGRLDAVIVDSGVSFFFAEAFDNVVVLDETLSDEQYGIAMKLGSDDFMALINAALAEIIEDGTYDELFCIFFSSVEAAEAE